MSTCLLTEKLLIRAKRRSGFTLIELLVVIAIIGVLSSILLPALARSKARAQGTFCLNNTRQLIIAWTLYADDHNDLLAYNLGAGGTNTSMSLNWVNNLVDWNVSNSDNTNAAKLVATGLGPYTSKSTGVYRCPSDNVLSGPQQQAGWIARVRSYSMNAMVGDAGNFSQGGFNVNNPDYVQFFKYSAIPQPASIFVFLDEHPDSIYDGYFLNSSDDVRWRDLPASYHDGAASFSFADGHAQAHRWRSPTTRKPAMPYVAGLPIPLPSNAKAAAAELADFNWVISAMSVERVSDYYHY
jgi:prepilin-type N-terminal cleavage/methylation domain-containing protein/prepilin-type processing-associated H-X9-DG protein